MKSRKHSETLKYQIWLNLGQFGWLILFPYTSKCLQYNQELQETPLFWVSIQIFFPMYVSQGNGLAWQYGIFFKINQQLLMRMVVSSHFCPFEVPWSSNTISDFSNTLRAPKLGTSVYHRPLLETVFIKSDKLQNINHLNFGKLKKFTQFYLKLILKWKYSFESYFLFLSNQQ